MVDLATHASTHPMITPSGIGWGDAAESTAGHWDMRRAARLDLGRISCCEAMQAAAVLALAESVAAGLL